MLESKFWSIANTPDPEGIKVPTVYLAGSYDSRAWFEALSIMLWQTYRHKLFIVSTWFEPEESAAAMESTEAWGARVRKDLEEVAAADLIMGIAPMGEGTSHELLLAETLGIPKLLVVPRSMKNDDWPLFLAGELSALDYTDPSTIPIEVKGLKNRAETTPWTWPRSLLVDNLAHGISVLDMWHVRLLKERGLDHDRR